MDSVDPSRRKAHRDRVILHIDLDCFYCQVEHRRLNIARDIPLAVQQWDGLIAVNYPARSRGITRHMRAKEAKVKCNDLVLVHVETLGVDDPANDPGIHTRRDHEGQASNDRLNKKACLERYRLANAEILDVLHTEIPSCPIEKASIDEVYIDVTTLVDNELALRYPCSESDHHMNGFHDHALFSWGSIVYGGEHLGALDPSSQSDVRLACGAMIASRLRGAIQTQCKFTSSAGISYNKLLAKIGSAKNKPNQQTLIRPSAVESLMSELPLRKLKNFGGKLGEELECLCHVYISDSTSLTVRDILKIPHAKLQSKFGPERASWILDLVHGLDGDSEVLQKERTKSMLAAKSFSPTSDLKVIARWFGILASELESRMKTDLEMYNRKPKTLVLSFRSKSSPQDRTRQSPMPVMPNGKPCRHTLANAALDIFKSRCTSEAFPCVRLGLSASDFQDCPNEKLSIARFFSFGTEKGENAQKIQKSDAVAQSTCDTMHHRLEQTSDEKHGGIKSIQNVSAADLNHAVDDFNVSLLSDVDIEQQKMLLKEASMLHRLQKRKSDHNMRSHGEHNGGKKVEKNTKKKKEMSGKSIAQYFS